MGFKMSNYFKEAENGKLWCNESVKEMAKRLFEDGWRISRPENEEE